MDNPTIFQLLPWIMVAGIGLYWYIGDKYESKNRQFLVCYFGNTKVGNYQVRGTFTIETTDGVFPSQDWILNHIRLMPDKIENPVITSIYEFESDEDYANYIKEFNDESR